MAAAAEDDESKTINDDGCGAVAGSADLANRGVGVRPTPSSSRKNPEQTPNKALYPTVADDIVSAGG